MAAPEPAPGACLSLDASEGDNRNVDTNLSASLTDLIFISIVPTFLLAGWLIVIFRATRDYDKR
jgi:hypothetical protein